MEGHWKFLGGVLQAKILEGKYEAKLDFHEGRGCKNKKVWIFSGTAQSQYLHVYSPNCSPYISYGTS